MFKDGKLIKIYNNGVSLDHLECKTSSDFASLLLVDWQNQRYICEYGLVFIASDWSVFGIIHLE